MPNPFIAPDPGQLIAIANLVASARTALRNLTPSLLSDWSKRDDLDLLSNDRAKALQHAWTGSFLQRRGPDSEQPLSGQIAINLKCSKRQIKGAATFSAVINNTHIASQIHMLGGVRHERFLHFEYVNVDRSKVHFGTILLTLSSNGKAMEGQFLGFGVISEKWVEGTVTLGRADA